MTNPSEKLHVVGNARFTGVGSLAQTYDLGLTSNGTLTTSTSDETMKTGIKSLGDGVLSKVMELNPVSFSWIDGDEGNKDIGFIAQEVNNIFPEITFINQTDGKMGINYSRLPSILTKAIQEQQVIIQENGIKLDSIEKLQDSQTSQLATLENDVSFIKSVLGMSDDDTQQSTQSSPIETILANNSEVLNSIREIYENMLSLVETLGLKSVDGGLVVESAMNVLGDTTLSNLTVTGDLIAGMMKLDTVNNSLGVIGTPCYNPETGEIKKDVCEDQTLYLQKELTGNLDIFDGKLVIEPDGTMKLAGSLEVEGTVQTKQLVIKSDEESASAGKVTIPSGQKSVTINTSAVKEDSIIMVTPERPVLIGSKYKEEGKFEITLKDVESKDLQVSWFILGNTQTSSSDNTENNTTDTLTDTNMDAVMTDTSIVNESTSSDETGQISMDTPLNP